MSTLKIEIDEKKLRELVSDYIEEKTGNTIDETNIQILVKSKQNYKSEWETASFKATVEILL